MKTKDKFISKLGDHILAVGDASLLNATEVRQYTLEAVLDGHKIAQAQAIDVLKAAKGKIIFVLSRSEVGSRAQALLSFTSLLQDPEEEEQDEGSFQIALF